MKNRVKVIVLTLSLIASSAIASGDSLQKIRGLNIFKGKNLQINTIKEHESLYQIKGVVGGRNPFNAYITKDFKEVVFGKGFDAQTKQELEIPIDSEKYKKNAEYVVGSGKNEYILFTDPECPYCHKFEKILPLLHKDTKFYVYLFPLSFHKHSKAMSYYIMSQKDDKNKARVMHEIANGSSAYKNAKFSFDELQKLKAKLKKEQQLANEIGVRGTPSIYNIKGNKVEWTQLLDKYNIKKPIDMAGVSFLEKGKLVININKSKKKPLYIFASLDTKKSMSTLKNTIKKYKNKNALKLFLTIKPQSKYKDELISIYTQKDNRARVRLLNKFLKSGIVDKKIVAVSKKKVKGEEAKYVPVLYVMQKMGIKSSDSIVILTKEGKILK